MYQNIPMYDIHHFAEKANGISVWVEVERYSPLLTSVLHWHNYYDISLITQGKGIHHLNGKDYEISEGSIIFTRPTDMHRFETIDEIESVSVHFTDDAVSDKYKTLLEFINSMKILDKSETEIVKAYAMAIIKSQENLKVNPKNEIELDLVQRNFELLLLTVGRNFNVTPQQANNKVVQALKYINVHFREPLTLDNVAKQFNYTPSYFSTWFKHNTDYSFTEYLNSLRISYAITLLKRGYSVTDSCFTSGFGSLSRFNFCFKQKTGKTPREYVNECKNIKPI